MAVRRSAPSSEADPQVIIPKTVADPVWSLRPWPVSVHMIGTRYEIPALSAADWLAILMSEDPDLDDIFPGLLEEKDQDVVTEAMLDGHLEETFSVCLDIITAVSGRPWYIAMRLIDVARNSWHVLGAEMLLKGVDADRLSLSGWLDILLLTIMKNIDPKDATMFALRLETPPADIEAEQPEPEMSASSFMSMA